VPIRPFLSDEAFDPETIREMSLALESVCSSLGLKVIDDPATKEDFGLRLFRPTPSGRFRIRPLCDH
jgi:hypothetical protein